TACLFYDNLFKELFLCSRALRPKAVAKIGLLFLTAKSFGGKFKKKCYYFCFLDKRKWTGNSIYTGLTIRSKQYIRNLTLMYDPHMKPGIKKENLFIKHYQCCLTIYRFFTKCHTV
ncbi:MAG: hypothetical protein LKF70_01750, partial [Prevotella sp.]|nr:hypothetical protein [Prevotella sp.]